MATTITAGNATNGAAISSDNTGILELKTGTGSGTTAMTVDASQNVGVGISSPLQRFNAVNTAITGGAPASSGSAADPNAVARFQAGSVALDVGVYAAGQMWLQPRSFTNYAINYDLVLQPNGGNVGIGTASPSYTLDVQTGVAIIRAKSSTASNSAWLVLEPPATGSAIFHNPTNTPSLFTTNATERARIPAAGGFLVTSDGGGLGYGTGSGGTVTQATNKSTAVTLNKPTGQITMNNAALAANTTVTFQLTNSVAATTDGIVLTFFNGGVGSSANYLIWGAAQSGSAIINVRNISGGSLSEAIVINFAIIKGATS